MERVFVGNRYGDVARGVFLVRGENVVLMGEIVSSRLEAHNHVYFQSMSASDLTPCFPFRIIIRMISIGPGRRRRSTTFHRCSSAPISTSSASRSQGSGSRIKSKERSQEGRHPSHSSWFLCRQERRRRHVLERKRKIPSHPIACFQDFLSPWFYLNNNCTLHQQQSCSSRSDSNCYFRTVQKPITGGSFRGSIQIQ